MGDGAAIAVAGAGAPAVRRYEGVWRRFVAAAIDNATWLVAIFWLLGFVPASLREANPELTGILFLVLFSAWFNYFAFAEWRWGQTIGKSVVGARVTTLDGGRISFGQASVRNLLRLVDFLVVGWVLIAASERRQRLGDLAAKTVVLSKGTSGRNYGKAPGTPSDSRSPGLPDGARGSPRHGRGGFEADREASPVAESSGEMPPGAPVETGPGQGPPGSGAPPGEELPRRPGPDRGRLPAIGWGLKETIYGLIGGVLVGTIVPLVLVAPFDPDLDGRVATIAAQALFAATLAVFAVGVASRWRFFPLSRALGQLGLGRASVAGFGTALLVLLAYYAFAIAFSVVVVEPQQEDIAMDLGVEDPNLAIAVAAVLLLTLVAPFVEELFFRGMIFSGIRSRLSFWPAAIVSGLIFGIPHALTGPTAVIPLSVLGVALAWLYQRTGSLWPCVFAHVVNNAIAVAFAS